MTFFFENIWQIILMPTLLLLSAFMSGCETAYFNISRRDAERLSKSPHKLANMAARLLDNPKRLLVSLLFSNMAVNVTFVTMASALAMKLTREVGQAAAIAMSVGAFVGLLLFGEMLPKSFAYSHSARFCRAAAPVCSFFVRVVSPVVRVFEVLIVGPVMAFVSGPGRGGGKGSDLVTASQLKMLTESSRQKGLISTEESRLFAEVIELGFLRVRHVMQPRVDMVACEIGDSAANMVRTMNENGLTKIPVYVETIDNIAGVIHQRDLLGGADIPIEKLLVKANYVPEQKSVESLLEFFRESKSDTAIAVDEYGGIAGAVSVEDIVEQLLGPIEPGDVEPIEAIGPLTYRLAANLPIHDWAEVLGIDPANSRVVTVGGLMMVLVGKIPKEGDTAYLKNLKLTVEKVKKNRIESLIVSLESAGQ